MKPPTFTTEHAVATVCPLDCPDACSLAVTVQSWMPAVLTEGAYVVIPEQEAALRNAAYQERYARSIVDGLEAYFRGLSR